MSDSFFAHERVTVIAPARRWGSLDLRELWAYRELAGVLTLRDIRLRYKQTALGASWAILQPLLTTIVFSVVFGRLAHLPSDGIPYPVFFFAALLPWTFFANAVGQSAASLVGSSQLVSKVYFPRLIVPLASIGSNLVDLAVSALVLLALMAWYGVAPSWRLLALPLLVVVVLLTALGVGTLLSALTVEYRDFRFVVPFLLQIWMFATPVAYSASLVPPRWRWLLALNPMSGWIEATRAALFDRPWDVPSLALSFGVTAILFLAGIAYFERAERRFADVI